MCSAPDKTKTEAGAVDAPGPDLPVYDIPVLMRGGREAVLQHEGSNYRLRITAQGKLILTK